MMHQPIFKVEHLSKSYNKTRILYSLSFEVYERELIGSILMEQEKAFIKRPLLIRWE